MQNINKVFFRGLLTLIPIAVTLYILTSVVQMLENVLGVYLRQWIPNYVPGIGLALTLVLIYAFGLLLNNMITSRFLAHLERRLSAVPFIKAIYSPLKDLMNLFSSKDDPNLKRVVLVRMGDSQALALGLMTRDQFADLNLSNQTEGRVAVYFPFSYGLGGYTFLVPRSAIQEVDLPAERAMSLAITGWVKVDKT